MYYHAVCTGNFKTFGRVSCSRVIARDIQGKADKFTRRNFL